MLLRDSTHASALDTDTVARLALAGAGRDESGRRAELVRLVADVERFLGAPDR
jgi:hypothetical protein